MSYTTTFPSVRRLFIVPFLAFSLVFAEEAVDQDSEEPKVERRDSVEETEAPAGSAMPPRPERPERRTGNANDLEELDEVRVRERLGLDPTPYLEDPLILKTEEERRRELIRRHMDIAARILNRWTIPLLGIPLAEHAEQRQREADLEAFQARQERDLRALRVVDEDYYRVRKAEYYDTVLQARDRW